MPPPESLKSFAKYLWWKTPEEAVARPERLYAQIMDIGDYDDVLRLVALVGDETLRQVLIRRNQDNSLHGRGPIGTIVSA